MAPSLDGDSQSLRGFLQMVECDYPTEVLRIRTPVRTHLDITSLVFELERAGNAGPADDIDTVIVDGKVIMEGGVIPAVDFASLREAAQTAGEQVWAALQDWDPLGRTHEEACPWCYAMDG